MIKLTSWAMPDVFKTFLGGFYKTKEYTITNLLVSIVVKMQNICNLIGWKSAYIFDIFNCYRANINGMWNAGKLGDKVVIVRCLVQCWQIFFSFLIFCCYFTHLKSREISCKRRETREIFPILHSAPCDNNYLYDKFKYIYPHTRARAQIAHTKCLNLAEARWV